MTGPDAEIVAATVSHFLPEPIRPHSFLDAFSIIENGEHAKRYEREIAPSATTRALLHLADEHEVAALSPRAFETLVAGTLAEIGFSSVTLRRYSKDGGADIVGIIAYGKQEETVVVEVKHSARPVGLKVLDRLNGVRDREGADRALLVASSHITSCAQLAYTANSSYVSARTFRELRAFLRDCPGWRATPHGLWVKGSPQ